MNINLNDFTKLILEFKLSIASEKMIANPVLMHIDSNDKIEDFQKL
jgi:hypothetical protein